MDFIFKQPKKRNTKVYMQMSGDKTIWEAAKGFIDRYGGAAPDEAAKRAEELRTAGDQEGAKTWSQIATAAKELLSDEKSSEDTIH